MKFYPNKKYAFDLDGTLVGCKEKQLYLWNLAHREIAGTQLNIYKFWEDKKNGKNSSDILRSFGLSEYLTNSICNYWAANIENIEYTPLDRPTALLQKLLKLEIPTLTIITARQKAAIVNIQVQNLIAGRVKYNLFAVNHEDVAKNKAKILIDRKIDVYLGDTEIDYDACKLANIEFQFVSGGQRSSSFMRKYIAKNKD